MTASKTVPGPAGAAVGRRIGIGLMYGLWRPRVLGAWRVPATGPVILAVNHLHNIDGPMLMGTAPRPVHFLIKKEAFAGPLDPFLRGIGQLKVDRASADRQAVMSALGVLRRGGVLGIFPEGSRGEGDFASLRSGLTYFAVRSGAPIVPVAVLGSAERRSRVLPVLPPLRSRIDVVFGEPFEAVPPPAADREPDGDGGAASPARREGKAKGGTRVALDAATVRVQERLRDHLEEARRLTGR